MDNNTCKSCGTSDNTEEYSLKEVMFGLNEEFDYFKCNYCGCLQIKNIPVNMRKYYPSNYLSFNSSEKSALMKYLMSKRNQFAFSGKSLLGKFLVDRFGYPDFYIWLSEAGLKQDDFILEVGCGKGELLLKLQKFGFSRLMGIDPFIENDIISNNVKILKRNLTELRNELFDWVMFHHSFEHADNPQELFIALRNVLKDDGSVLIRVPVIDSYAWDTYKTNWVQLDPPRHFFLYTTKSIKIISENYGFKIYKIVNDSTSFQFWGSEQNIKNINLMDSNSHFVNHRNSIFSKDEIKQFGEKAIELNKIGKGDTACFYLKKCS
jgi:SAM-dependent methyltransferase